MSEDKFQGKYRTSSARAAWHDYCGGIYFVTMCTQGRENYFGSIMTDYDGTNIMHLSMLGEKAQECILKMESLHNDIIIPSWIVMPDHIHLLVVVGMPGNIVGPNCLDAVTPNCPNDRVPFPADVETPIVADDVTPISADAGTPFPPDVGTPIFADSGTPFPPDVETPYYDVSTGKTSPISESLTDITNEKMREIAHQCGRLSHMISRFKTAVTCFARQNNIPFGWQSRFHDHIVRDNGELKRIVHYIENNVANWGK
ncbi:MAG: hypothetical protein K6A41_02745 [Bacteroidales bacterium]|nr:hypothetical protein [Bacteroidales bacterium]